MCSALNIEKVSSYLEGRFVNVSNFKTLVFEHGVLTSFSVDVS